MNMERSRGARRQMKAHDSWMRVRMRVIGRLELAGHREIRVRKSRAVIDQPYKHARMQEVVLTYRLAKPIVLSLETLDHLCSKHKLMRTPTQRLYTVLMAHAAAWARERKPVRHQRWNDEARA